jgi:hypothetical protein
MSDAPEAPKKTTVTVNLDGVEIEAEPGQLVIAPPRTTAPTSPGSATTSG